MKKILLIIILIAVGVLGWFVYSYDQSVQVHNTSDNLLFENKTYDISFVYPSKYTLSERDGITSDLQKYHEITLINKNDLPLPVNGEGPTAITIDVYSNDSSRYTAEEWARNAKESNLKLGEGRIATTTVFGLPAVSFRWSGLYEGTTIVLAKSDKIYAFNVTYLEMGAQIIQDFVVVRDSVTFGGKSSSL